MIEPIVRAWQYTNLITSRHGEADQREDCTNALFRFEVKIFVLIPRRARYLHIARNEFLVPLVRLEADWLRLKEVDIAMNGTSLSLQ